jgi:predicted secreted hydrolase
VRTPARSLVRSFVVSVALVAVACGGEVAVPEPPAIAITEVLAGDSAGFARADRPRVFIFPRDHGIHPDFRTEWWYFTGHLRTESGREFGFQLTFFRSALAPPAAPAASAARADPVASNRSAWRPNDVWMAHLAIGDFSGGVFRPYERFARGALGLAGASAATLDVWLEDWRATALCPDDPSSPVRLVAAEGDVALDLVLHPLRPPLLQGDEGLSQKGSQPGNASYYYSVTRWQVAGTLRINAEMLAVQGAAWMDREWSSSALEPGQVGWDWFSLQLDDGSDLMLYVIRRADGSVDPSSSGTWLSPAGQARRLDSSEFTLLSTATWTSPSGVQYPAAWRLDIAPLDLALEVLPLLADQELRGTFRYWEGGVRATGTRGGQPVVGRGFVELAGYEAKRTPASGD